MPRAKAATKKTSAAASPHTLTFIHADPAASYTTTPSSPPPPRHPSFHIRWAAPLSPSSFSAPPPETKNLRGDAWTAEEKERCLHVLTLIWERAPGMGKMEAWRMAERLMRDVWGMTRSRDAVAKVWRGELGAVWEERQRARREGERGQEQEQQRLVGERAGEQDCGGEEDDAQLAVGEQLAAGAVEGATAMAGEGEGAEGEARSEEGGAGLSEEQKRAWFGGELSEELERELFGGELSELSEELEKDLFGGELNEEQSEEQSEELSEELERELFGGDEVDGEE